MRLKLEFGKITEKVNINELYDEFAEVELNETDEELKLKEIIYKRLSEPDRRVLLMYAHFASLTKVGEQLGVSATAIFNKIKAIREKIKEEMKK